MCDCWLLVTAADAVRNMPGQSSNALAADSPPWMPEIPSNTPSSVAEPRLWWRKAAQLITLHSVSSIWSTTRLTVPCFVSSAALRSSFLESRLTGPGIITLPRRSRKPTSSKPWACAQPSCLAYCLRLIRTFQPSPHFPLQ